MDEQVKMMLFGGEDIETLITVWQNKQVSTNQLEPIQTLKEMQDQLWYPQGELSWFLDRSDLEEIMEYLSDASTEEDKEGRKALQAFYGFANPWYETLSTGDAEQYLKIIEDPLVSKKDIAQFASLVNECKNFARSPLLSSLCASKERGALITTTCSIATISEFIVRSWDLLQRVAPDFRTDDQPRTFAVYRGLAYSINLPMHDRSVCRRLAEWFGQSEESYEKNKTKWFKIINVGSRVFVYVQVKKKPDGTPDEEGGKYIPYYESEWDVIDADR
jgi:hypothetical protein